MRSVWGTRRRHAASLALTAAVLLTSCSSGGQDVAAERTPDDSPAAPLSSSATTGGTTEASGTDPADDAADETTDDAAARPPDAGPPPEPPRGRRGPAGQRAFARFVAETWAWALRSNDPQPLLKASRGDTCRGCAALRRELRKRDRQGWYVDLPALELGRTRLHRSGDPADVITARTRVQIPESDSFFYDGGYRSTSPAHSDATFTTRMTYRRGAYRLVSFTVS